MSHREAFRAAAYVTCPELISSATLPSRKFYSEVKSVGKRVQSRSCLCLPQIPNEINWNTPRRTTDAIWCLQKKKQVEMVLNSVLHWLRPALLGSTKTKIHLGSIGSIGSIGSMLEISGNHTMSSADFCITCTQHIPAAVRNILYSRYLTMSANIWHMIQHMPNYL